MNVNLCGKFIRACATHLFCILRRPFDSEIGILIRYNEFVVVRTNEWVLKTVSIASIHPEILKNLVREPCTWIIRKPYQDRKFTTNVFFFWHNHFFS